MSKYLIHKGQKYVRVDSEAPLMIKHKGEKYVRVDDDEPMTENQKRIWFKNLGTTQNKLNTLRALYKANKYDGTDVITNLIKSTQELLNIACQNGPVTETAKRKFNSINQTRASIYKDFYNREINKHKSNVEVVKCLKMINDLI